MNNQALSNTTERELDRSGAERAVATGFETLGLSPALLTAVGKAGYTTPTPIQEQAIPVVLEGRDLLGCAQTGTGKTAAFALPILQRLLTGPPRKGRPAIRALVLAPTRELAAQIAASFDQYAPPGRVRCQVVFGGVGKRPQQQALQQGVDVLVATPGRLIDLMADGVVDFRELDTFVLDEADRMLDMGFIRDVRRIGDALPRQRQTLLFSATMPDPIRRLAARILKNPCEVAVDAISSTRAPTAQSVYFVATGSKLALLLGLLEGSEIERALVFTRTKHGADRVAKKLVQAGVEADAIHGNKSQAARERALARFKRGASRVVVATDIAARGIDVKDLSHVINYDVPNEPETYVHRVGRTGRAGASGTAISLCSSEERAYVQAIERLTRRDIERRPLPEGLAVDAAADVVTTRPSRGGARRKSGGSAGHNAGSHAGRKARGSAGRSASGSAGRAERIRALGLR